LQCLPYPHLSHASPTPPTANYLWYYTFAYRVEELIVHAILDDNARCVNGRYPKFFDYITQRLYMSATIRTVFLYSSCVEHQGTLTSSSVVITQPRAISRHLWQASEAQQDSLHVIWSRIHTASPLDATSVVFTGNFVRFMLRPHIRISTPSKANYLRYYTFSPG
jgi:hypothetical protein